MQMNSSSFNYGSGTNYDKQWAFEVAYFIQHIGTTLQNLGNLLNIGDYVETRVLAAEMKQRQNMKKNPSTGFQNFGLFCTGPQAV